MLRLPSLIHKLVEDRPACDAQVYTFVHCFTLAAITDDHKLVFKHRN